MRNGRWIPLRSELLSESREDMTNKKNRKGKKGSDHPAKKTAVLALLTAAAILMGYVESLIPLNFGIPGIKIGLCNIVIMIVLLQYSWKEAFLISVVRILAVGFLFGNLFSILYSLSGAVLSILVMALLLKSRRFGILGISAAGGCVHNIGQLLAAKIVLPGLPLLWYTPVLMLAGLAAGSLVAVVVFEIMIRLTAAAGQPNM